MKKPVRITFAQKMAIAAELQKHCTKDAEGFAVWEKNWDDDRVAAVCGSPINNIHVRNVRREIIGSTRRGGQKTDDMAARLEAIEDYLTSKYPGWREDLQKAAA